MRQTVWIVGVLSVGLAAGGYAWFHGERVASVRYRTAAVERGPLVKTVTATGAINPVVAVPVGSQVSGMIQSLHADFNSVVKAGDIVARIDPAPFQKRRDQAAASLAMVKAMVAKARVDLQQRRRELARAHALLDQQYVSQNDVDVAVTALQGAVAQQQAADAQVKQAAASLHAAELEFSYTMIRSPLDGVVIARNVEVGQTVASSFATPNLFLIARDLSQMEVDTTVSESDIGGITEDNAAVFTVDAYPGEQFEGQVRQVRSAPISIQNVVTYHVVLRVDNTDRRLKPGMTANVSILVDRKDHALKVPNAALRFTPPQSYAVTQTGDARHDVGTPVDRSKVVWKAEASGSPRPVAIQPGMSAEGYTEVAGGELKEGDLVIVGIDMPAGRGKAGALPPGFGGGASRPHSPGRGW